MKDREKNTTFQTSGRSEAQYKYKFEMQREDEPLSRLAAIEPDTTLVPGLDDDVLLL
jgi:hypothetical protein